jgi:hypothetical protein
MRIKMKITDGDWRYNRIKDCIETDNRIIAQVIHQRSGRNLIDNEAEANSKLLLASPLLLDTLFAILVDLELRANRGIYNGDKLDNSIQLSDSIYQCAKKIVSEVLNDDVINHNETITK